MRHYLFVIIVALMLLSSCRKDCKTPCTWGCGSLNFSGITDTDPNGNIINGQTDNTDWKLDEQWCEKELGYFNETDLSKFNNTGLSTSYRDSTINMNTATGTGGGNNYQGPITLQDYPNPYVSQFVFSLNNYVNATYIKIVILNSSSAILAQLTESFPSHLNFNFNMAGKTSPGEICRVYYIVKFNNSDYYFKGHGDIECMQ